MIKVAPLELMSAKESDASTLSRGSFPAFSSETVQMLVGVLEVLADPPAGTDFENVGNQLRSLADEFSGQGVASSFVAIMTGTQDPLELNQQANDIATRLTNLAERLSLR